MQNQAAQTSLGTDFVGENSWSWWGGCPKDCPMGKRAATNTRGGSCSCLLIKHCPRSPWIGGPTKCFGILLLACRCVVLSAIVTACCQRFRCARHAHILAEVQCPHMVPTVCPRDLHLAIVAKRNATRMVRSGLSAQHVACFTEWDVPSTHAQVYAPTGKPNSGCSS